jgi:hypothetical protein
MGFFDNWGLQNYAEAGIGAAGVGAGLAAGQQAPVKSQLKRTKYDITMPIFNAEIKARKILTMKDECKSNWWGNGFNSMVYDLLFFELEELQIFNDTGHLINGEYLYVVNKNLVNIDNIKKLHKTGFKNELKCYNINEKELYNFLVHYKNKAVTNASKTHKNVNKHAKVTHATNKNKQARVTQVTNKNKPKSRVK